MTDKETKVPKNYTYTIEGIDRKYSIPSNGLDISNEFDADTLIQSAALSFYLEEHKYHDPSLWPLVFKFSSLTSKIEMKVELHYSPSFLIKPNSLIIKEELVAPKRTRKIKEK